MRRRLVVVALAVFSAVTGGAQGAGTGTPQGGVPQGGQRTPPRAARAVEPPVPRGTAVLRGQVVALDTGAPVRRAQVRVSAQNVREARLATTDADGRYTFLSDRAQDVLGWDREASIGMHFSEFVAPGAEAAAAARLTAVVVLPTPRTPVSK